MPQFDQTTIESGSTETLYSPGDAFFGAISVDTVKKDLKVADFEQAELEVHDPLQITVELPPSPNASRRP